VGYLNISKDQAYELLFERLLSEENPTGPHFREKERFFSDDSKYLFQQRTDAIVSSDSLTVERNP